MAMTESNCMAVGTPAPDFSLPDLDGRVRDLASFGDAKVLVVIFTCNHCPVARAVEDRLVALANDYAPRGVALVAINPNADSHPGDTVEKMRERAAEKGFPFPYLADAAQIAGRAYRAACTPDLFVFDGARRCIYNGQLDDNWRDPAAVTRHDLRLVLDATLAGEPVGFDPVPSIGCSIKWKD